MSRVVKWKKLFRSFFCTDLTHFLKKKKASNHSMKKKDQPERILHGFLLFFFGSNLKTSDWQNQQEVRQLWIRRLTMDTANPICAFSHLLYISLYILGWVNFIMLVCPGTASNFLFSLTKDLVDFLCLYLVSCKNVIFNIFNTGVQKLGEYFYDKH